VKLDVEAIRTGQREAMQTLQRVCARCARIGVARMGAPDDLADDVAQELAVLFLTDLIDRYSPDLDVEPMLIESARRLTSGMLRKSWRELASGAPGDDPLLSDAPSGEPDVEEQVARQAARDEAIKAREVLLARARQAREAPPAPPQGDGVDMTDDELVEFLQRAVSLLDEIARRHGLTLPEPPAGSKRPRKTHRPIIEHLHDWAARLRISLDDPAWHVPLADRIGAHRATVWRWRQGKTHPSQRMIDTIEAVVSQLESAT
jgi:DNA-directed RNA polymerase specialized sigma24 family protein